MNFSADDPLADLLSDNSVENESFFENLTGAHKKPLVQKASATKSKGKLEDLFGIKEEMEQDLTTTSIANRPAATSTPRITTQKPSESQEEEDDDDYLGFDPKKPKAGFKKDLLDDILTAAIESKRPTTSAPATTSSTATAKLPISRQSTDTTTDNSTFQLAQQRPKTSSGRRSSGTSAVVNTDHLGLFGASAREANPSTSGMSTPMTKKRVATADWLGLGAPLLAETQTNSPNNYLESPPTARSAPQADPTDVAKEPVEIMKPTETECTDAMVANEGVVGEELSSSDDKKLQATNTAQNILLLNSMNMESSTSLAALQQQESNIMLATQMKNQERTLLEMKHRQETLLQQQERQFQMLVQQQLQRQQKMEKDIKMQNFRINSHLQLMMSQPPVVTPLPGSEVDVTDKDEHSVRHANSELAQSSSLEVVQMETEVKRLEFEKSHLEELLDNVKANSEREIEMLESSYKKQLKILEEHQEATESRLRADVDEQRQYFAKKLITLETDRDKMKEEFESTIATLKQDHEDELRKLKRSQEDDLEMIKEEHRRMLENIRQTKMLEFAMVQENGSYLQTLKVASSNLENLSGDLQGLRDDLQGKIETINLEKELKLETRERKIQDVERRLQISEEKSDGERTRLMDLVSSLELQLSNLSRERSEEQWVLRQKMATLDAERTSFEKEKQFVREQHERDELRMSALKDAQLSETQRISLELQAEQARLQMERTKLETQKKLQPTGQLEQERLQLDAAMQVARDATQQADTERERYQRLQRHLEQHRRKLIDHENMLQAKQQEIELEVQSFRVAERRSQEMLQRAKVEEQAFQTKLQFLQQRMREVSEKEATLSQERLLITHERVGIQNMKRKLSQRRCALCKMNEQNEQISQWLNKNSSAAETANDYMPGLPVDGPIPAEDAAVADMLDGNECEAVCPVESTKLHLGPNYLDGANMVDRLLDDKIAESYRKMKRTTTTQVTAMPSSTGDYWETSVLDDDAKEMALHNIELKYSGYDMLNKISKKHYILPVFLCFLRGHKGRAGRGPDSVGFGWIGLD